MATFEVPALPLSPFLYVCMNPSIPFLRKNLVHSPMVMQAVMIVLWATEKSPELV